MLRWSNRVFMLIALLLLLWVFAQDRDQMFNKMQSPIEKATEAPKQESAPTTMPPQQQIEVPVVETKPAKKPVKTN